MKNTLRIFSFFLSLFLVVGFVSCSARKKSAEDILYEICAELELPSGQTYLMSAKEGEERFFSADMAMRMYGNGFEANRSLLEDYAIYVSSFAMPYEVAIFKCYSKSDTDTIMSMCMERADEIKVVLKNSEGQDISENISIYSDGKYVVMILLNNISLQEVVQEIKSVLK